MRSIFALASVLIASGQPTYMIQPWAGTSSAGDGRLATSAMLLQPSGLAADLWGNLYVADARDHRVRCISRDGTIHTIAGTGTPGWKPDVEEAATSPLKSPYGLAVDLQGNVYIADLGNALIRRVGRDGRIVTIAGGGAQTPSITGSRGSEVRLLQPRDVTIDRTGNLFVADFGANQIYRVTPAGVLTVVAGTGRPGTFQNGVLGPLSSLTGPAGLAIDSLGTLYIADSGAKRIRKLSPQGWISTVTDSEGKEIELGTPTGLAVDSSNRLYIADGGTRVTVVWPNGEFLSLPLGGTAIAVGPTGEVYSIVNRELLRLTGGAPAVVAGNSTGYGAGDGVNRAEWRFLSPSNMVRDSAGNLFIADTANGMVRKISPAGQLSTVTTKLAAPTSVAIDSQSRLYVGDRATCGVYRFDNSGQLREVIRNQGRAMSVDAMAFDPHGSLYFTDSQNHIIRRVSPDGSMTVVAGGGAQAADGAALLLKLNAPWGLAFDGEGALWFTEAGSGRLRKLQQGRVTTLAKAELREPRGFRIDSTGHFVVTDSALHGVLRVAPGGATVQLAGSGDKGYSGDGEIATAAMLDSPLDVTLENDGGILVLDSGNHRIRLLKPYSDPRPAVDPPEAETVSAIEVLHAGTGRPQPVAPGQIAFVRGHEIAGCAVTVGGVAAPLLGAISDRLTVQVPPTLIPGVLEVSATRGPLTCGKTALDIVAIAPGLLTSAWGQALALNQDGQPNDIMTPAARASVVSLFLTGEGGGSPEITAQIGGQPADVVWAGQAPLLIGIYQVNVRMPGGFAPSGVVGVELRVNGIATQSGVTLVSR